MARILITGGAGYVGSHCAQRLARAGHQSVVFDSLVRGRRDAVRWSPLIVGDIRDQEALRAAFGARSFDAVMHFAAFAYVGESVRDPSLYYDVNIHGTRTLLQAMQEAGVNRIVFSSSCAVYGEPQTLPIRESSALAPVNPYGFSKLACERMMDDFGAAYGLKSVRLRYFNAAGADPGGEIGEVHDPETHLIPLALDAACRGGAPLRVFGVDYPTPDGTAVRDYIHVADLANAHVSALEHLLAGGETMAVNLGAGRGISVREIIAAVEKTTGNVVAVEEAPRRPGDPAVLVADPARAAARLGWKAESSGLAGIIGDAWTWRRKHISRI